jgi:hypothetical protein
MANEPQILSKRINQNIWVFIIPVAITFGINLAFEAAKLWTKNLAWRSNWFD